MTVSPTITSYLPNKDNELPRRKQRGIKSEVRSQCAASGGEFDPKRLT